MDTVSEHFRAAQDLDRLAIDTLRCLAVDAIKKAITGSHDQRGTGHESG